MMHMDEPTQSAVLRKRIGHADGTSAETHAQPARPALIAVQKLEVMIAIVSSPKCRCWMPKDESHVATACSCSVK